MDVRRQFTDEWCRQYQEATGIPYVFSGPKDAQAATRLLRSGLAPETILSTAREAWKHPDWFNCKHAASLAGLACRFNEIRLELKHPPTNGTLLALQRDELNRVLAEMKSIKYSYSENLDWSREDVARYRSLRQRRDELKQKLGVLV